MPEKTITVEQLRALVPHEIRCSCGKGSTFEASAHAQDCPRREVDDMLAPPTQPGVERGELEGHQFEIIRCKVCGEQMQSYDHGYLRCSCKEETNSSTEDDLWIFDETRHERLAVVSASSQPLLDLDALRKKVLERFHDLGVLSRVPNVWESAAKEFEKALNDLESGQSAPQLDALKERLTSDGVVEAAHLSILRSFEEAGAPELVRNDVRRALQVATAAAFPDTEEKPTRRQVEEDDDRRVVAEEEGDTEGERG